MKKGITLASAALAALTLVATAAPAFAADTTAGAVTTAGAQGSSATTWTSNTGVQFNEPTTVPPTTVTPPTGPTVPTNPAAVAIDWASDFDFGINDAGTKTEFNTLDGTATDKNALATPTVAFHDLQGTGTADYKIQANIGTDLGLAGSTLTLNGAGTLTNLKDTATQTTGLTSASGVTLTSAAQDIVTGIGVTPGYFDDQFTGGATLTVPLSSQQQGSNKGAYTGTIVWSMVAAQ